MSADSSDRRVTANAVLLLGYIAAAVTMRDDPTYDLVSVEPDAGTQLIQHRLTGNTYRVSVEQIGGVA